MEYDKKKKTYWSIDEATLNIQKFCAIQDRCHSEVRTRLLEHGIYGDELEEIISDLISNGFLDEERFAKSYARGKFRMKGWGRNKIIHELKLRKVSNYSIQEGLKEIEDDDYFNTLERLFEKKKATTTFKDKFDFRKKMINFFLNKGFDYELIISVLEKSEKNK